MAADRQKIGMLGLSKGAGAGFLAVNLSRMLVLHNGCRPGVAELGSGGLYDSLGMDKRFAGKDYFPFHQAVASERSLRGKNNEYFGINWVLRTPEEKDLTLNFEQRLRITANASGDPLFCSFAGVPEEESLRLLCEMDHVVLVVDPLPSRILPAYRFLCELRKRDFPLTYVINKWNGGVDRKELLQYLQIKEPVYIPAIPSELIYGAEYACRPVMDMASAEDYLQQAMEKLSAKIFDFSA